jgi:CheY-like chemotaxis protein
LKADKKLASVPVIFLSALDETEDKVRAFRSGGVDYVTKPFQFDEVHARIETQLELQRARQAERQLLENTLTGAVKTLADLIQQTEPALAARSEAIRATVVHLTSKMELDAPWQYELGAILCLIGCIALPADVFERAYGRAPKGSDEEIFRTHPETGARLLAKIPRLEIVCEMIRQQQTAIGDSQPVSPAELGARMLRIAIELDRWIFRGISVEAALGQLKAVPHGFPPEMIEALKDYSPPRTATEIKDLQVKDLLVSMITEQDIVTNDGNFMIVRKGSVLNAPILEKVRNFDQTRGIRQPIRVQIPQSNDNHGLQ